METAINGVNARLISRITGKSIHAETIPRIRTFDILKAFRKRKYEWLGHILRMYDKRLVKHTVKKCNIEMETCHMSNMLADAPQTESFHQLVKIATHRKKEEVETNVDST